MMVDSTSTPTPVEAKPPSPAPQDEIVVTHHTLNIQGQDIPYTVTCGRLVLKEETEKRGDKEGEAEGEKPKASIFFIAYTRDDRIEKTSRPLTFSFNGGPGSASVWLHLGLLGPRRVSLDEAGWPYPPPYRLVDNEFSLLDISDLVFIDPVSTGFSRAVPGEKAQQFHDIKKDIESVGDFIRLYTTRYQRWTSPKFLIGESYGTTRAAGLSGYLQERHGLYLNGIILVSVVLNFQTLEFATGNDLPFILFIPTYTATAWYHQRLADDLQKKDLIAVLDEARAFALSDYTLALMKGSSISEEEKKQIVAQLRRYTGLSADYIERTNLRVWDFRFNKELLRDQRRTIGRIDSRFTGIDRDAAGEQYEDDPSTASILGSFAATLNDYVRGELGYESDLPYQVSAPLWRTWSWAENQNRYVDVADTLRKAIATNHQLKIFVANGYYDLATPFLATEYTISHLNLDPSLQANIQMRYYEAGHMMYIHRPSLMKMKEDLMGFIKDSFPAK